jgi:hypothetical protein
MDEQSERKSVYARATNPLPKDCLGGAVGERADPHILHASRTSRASEVDEERVAIAQNNILRFDVAVHDIP